MKKMFVSLILVVIIMSIMISVPLHLKKQEEADINNYSMLLDKLKNNFDVHSDLLIFPKDNTYITDFKYDSRNGLFDGSYYLYVVATYNKDEYDKELKRISEITYNDRNIKKCDNKYVSIYDRYGTYEYVILEDNKIIYVFNQLFDFNETDIKEEYILKDIDGHLKYGYNIYYEGE